MKENKSLFKRIKTKGRFELWGNKLNQFRIWRSGVIIREGASQYISMQWFELTNDYIEDL